MIDRDRFFIFSYTNDNNHYERELKLVAEVDSI